MQKVNSVGEVGNTVNECQERITNETSRGTEADIRSFYLLWGYFCDSGKVQVLVRPENEPKTCLAHCRANLRFSDACKSGDLRIQKAQADDSAA